MFFFYLVHQSISSQGDPLHCDQPLDLARTHLLSYSHGGGWIASYHMIRDVFASILEKNKVSCFAWTDACPSIPFPLVFSSTSLHRVINWSHLHLSGCGDCWPHLSRLGLLTCFILQGGYNNGNSGKGRILPQSTHDRCISSSCYRGFWVPTLISEWLSPPMH
jgi:hypothetical protein